LKKPRFQCCFFVILATLVTCVSSLTLAAVVSSLLCCDRGKLEHYVLVLESLVAVLEMLDVVDRLAQHARLVQLTTTHARPHEPLSARRYNHTHILLVFSVFIPNTRFTLKATQTQFSICFYKGQMQRSNM